MRTIDELNTALAEQATGIRELADKFHANNSSWVDGEQQKEWETRNADYDTTRREADQATAAGQISSRIALLDDHAQDPINPNGFGLDDASPGMVGTRQTVGGRRSHEDVEEDRMLAMSAWARRQYGCQPPKRELDAVERLNFPVNSNQLKLRLWDTNRLQSCQKAYRNTPQHLRAGFEFNAPLTTQTAETGGDIVPPETMLRRIEVNLLAFGGVREVAEIISTTSGEPLSWPTADDTGNKGRIIPENTAADDNAGGGTTGDGGPNPAFAKVIWGAHKYTSDTVLVPYELLEDAVVDVAALLSDMLAERIARITNEHYTTGAGTTEPSGVITGAALGVTAASNAAIDPDEIYALQHSVDPAYRNGAAFMAHDATVLAIRLLKDTTEQYLWGSSFNTGVPDSLAGAPMIVNQDVPVIATVAKVLLYGNFSHYKIRRVGSARMYRLVERYRERDQDGFVIFLREDGGLLDAGTPPIKYLQMAV